MIIHHLNKDLKTSRKERQFSRRCLILYATLNFISARGVYAMCIIISKSYYQSGSGRNRAKSRGLSFFQTFAFIK
jgi:hypothetical protein